MALVKETSTSGLLFNDVLQDHYHLESSDEGISSESDAGENCDSDSGSVTIPVFVNSFLDSDSDSDSSLNESMLETDLDDTCDEDDDEYDVDYEANEGESIKFTSVDTLCESLTYILAMPELCDVKFLVGPEKIEVHGVKAILSTRSRTLYSLILKSERELELNTSKSTGSFLNRRKCKKSKKTGSKQSLEIGIDNYEPDVFRKIIQFVHSGTVDVDVFSVIGLFRGADEFALSDLKTACWDYVDKCLESETSCDALMTVVQNCPDKTVLADILAKINIIIKSRMFDRPVRHASKIGRQETLV